MFHKFSQWIAHCRKLLMEFDLRIKGKKLHIVPHTKSLLRSGYKPKTMKTTKRIKLHNQKLRNFYLLQYNCKAKELKRLEWEGYIAHREVSELRCSCKITWKSYYGLQDKVWKCGVDSFGSEMSSTDSCGHTETSFGFRKGLRFFWKLKD